MEQPSPATVPAALKIGLGLTAFAAVSGVAFAAWADQGAGIFMAMVEFGLAWCF